MRCKNYMVGLFLLVLSSNLMATNTYTNDYLSISMLTPFSINEPQNPQWAGFTQVKFTSSITWLGGAGCAADAVVIRGEDTHILSIIMQAFAMNKPIRLYTWDTNRIDQRCILRAIALKP